MYYPRRTGKQSEKTLLECYTVFCGKQLPSCRRSRAPPSSSSSTAFPCRWIFSAYQSTGRNMSEVLKISISNHRRKLFIATNNIFSDKRFYSQLVYFWQKLKRSVRGFGLHKDSFVIIMTGAWGIQKVCEWQRKCLTLNLEESACFGNDWRDCETRPHIGRAAGPQPVVSVSDSWKRVRCSL
jgi:hypothetical protein